MTSYLIRGDEIVDKDSMVVIGYIDDDSKTITLDYVTVHAAYPNTLQELTHDYPEYSYIDSLFN